MSDFQTYQSPFTWRYGSPEMRQIWSEAYKRRLWRQLWVALAETEAEYGLVSQEQVDELRRQAGAVDVARALEIEAEIHHDLMAELKTFAEQAPSAGGSLHIGATSMDIEDNADALRIRQSLGLIVNSLRSLLQSLSDKVSELAGVVSMGYTHLQTAEPVTIGYRLAVYLQDLYADYCNLQEEQHKIKGKGFTGAVGTGASYADLIGVDNLPEFEAKLSARLDLPFYPIATQIYPRKQEYEVACALAGLGASLYKFAFDLRVLQSPPFGELAEPFGQKQVGSSAMPFKRNPINAEKIDSLARSLAQMPRLAWDNAAHSLLERTLDDSANRRTWLPEAFLTASELIEVARKLISGLQVNRTAIERNLLAYGPFAATERVLMGLAKAGADRQEMHSRLRQHALTAWQAVQAGGENPLIGLVISDPIFQQFLPSEQIRNLFDITQHTGDAAQRARNLAAAVQEEIKG